jgi:4-hydroxy-2-oxoheptanedioate aldolase
MKQLKKRLVHGETLLGCWLNLGSPVTAEIVGLAGFDWVLIDLEHGAGSEKDALYQIQALEHTPAAPIVRVESFERQRFHHVLDFGAEGVMCPRIKTVEEVHRAAQAMRYQPAGIRGVAKMVRATQFGVNFQDYVTKQENLIGVVQIETEEILGSLDAVAHTDGVDVLFVGPSDLSIALGTFGQKSHPRYIEAVTLVSKAAKKAGKATGILLPSPEEFPFYFNLGYRFIACGADAAFVSAGARNVLADIGRLQTTR